MGKSSGKIFEFDPLIYPRKIWICYNVKGKTLKTYFGSDIDNMDGNDASVYRGLRREANKKLGTFIRFESKKTMTTSNIAHESVHAALDILDELGSFVSSVNQEPFAYLVGYIAECCDAVKRSKQ